MILLNPIIFSTSHMRPKMFFLFSITPPPPIFLLYEEIQEMVLAWNKDHIKKKIFISLWVRVWGQNSTRKFVSTILLNSEQLISQGFNLHEVVLVTFARTHAAIPYLLGCSIWGDVYVITYVHGPHTVCMAGGPSEQSNLAGMLIMEVHGQNYI